MICQSLYTQTNQQVNKKQKTIPKIAIFVIKKNRQLQIINNRKTNIQKTTITHLYFDFAFRNNTPDNASRPQSKTTKYT